jgi:8-oxo-dGTP diphosphatase
MRLSGFMFMLKSKYIFAVAQKALIKKENKFLIVKRSLNARIYPKHWDLPGGKLEHNEKFDESLIREVKEETNLDIKVNSIEFIYVESMEANAYVVLFNCEIVGGDLKLSSEHTDYKWATKEEILKIKIEPYLQNYFRKK